MCAPHAFNISRDILRTPIHFHEALGSKLGARAHCTDRFCGLSDFLQATASNAAVTAASHAFSNLLFTASL
jgi:hypothetical protein